MIDHYPESTVAGYFDVFVGFSISSKAIKQLVSVSKEDCAMACLQEEDFNCRSFDYCINLDANTNYCLMHEYHVTANINQQRRENATGNELKLNMTSTDCVHYSSEWLSDDCVFVISCDVFREVHGRV